MSKKKTEASQRASQSESQPILEANLSGSPTVWESAMQSGSQIVLKSYSLGQSNLESGQSGSQIDW